MTACVDQQLAEAADGDSDVAAGVGFIVLVEGEDDRPFTARDRLYVGDKNRVDGVAEAVFGAVAVVDTRKGNGGIASSEGSACFFCAFGDNDGGFWIGEPPGPEVFILVFRSRGAVAI